jgi:hypothetical protein
MSTSDTPGPAMAVPPMVSTLVPGGVTGSTENMAVAPTGSPWVESATGSLNPWKLSRATLTVASSGAHTDTEDGSAAIV